MKETRHNVVPRERGQSLVEFGLVLPIVLLMIFGIIEFGRIANGLLSANHCANELARYAIVGRTADDVIEYARSEDNTRCPTLDLNRPDAELLVDVEFPAGVGVGKLVVVQVEYPVELIFPGVRDLFEDGIYRAPGRASLRMERSFIGSD